MPEYISKIVLPNGSTYLIKDLEARDLIAQIAAGSLAFVISTDAASTPRGITWTDGNQVITGTLPAAADTQGKIYLIPHAKNATTGNVDYYREYVTVDMGTSSSHNYIWEYLGNTDIDLSGLGPMAYARTATGASQISTVDSATFTSGTVAASGSYTPGGDVTVTLTQTTTAADLTKGDYTPYGTINKPDITVTPTTSMYGVMSTAGSYTAGTAATFARGAFSGGSFTQGTDTFVAPVLTMSVPNPSYSSASQFETLVIGWSSGSFTQGSDTFVAATHDADTFTANTPTSVTLPTFTSASLMTGATAALDAAPTFTGSLASKILVTGVNYNQASVNTATFSGTSTIINVSGTAQGTIELSSTAKTISITVQPDQQEMIDYARCRKNQKN